MKIRQFIILCILIVIWFLYLGNIIDNKSIDTLDISAIKDDVYRTREYIKYIWKTISDNYDPQHWFY